MLIQTAYASNDQLTSPGDGLGVVVFIFLVFLILYLFFIIVIHVMPAENYNSIRDRIAKSIFKHLVAKHLVTRGIDYLCHLEIEFLEAIYGVKKRVVLPGRTILDISVPAGIDNGQTIRLRGKGDRARTAVKRAMR